MAQDPAFLFYPGDYLRDTQCLSEPAQVAYDRIMCEHMRNICISQKQLDFFTKRLTPDQKTEVEMVLTKVDGGFQIKWVAESILKRRDYSESRRQNRTKPKKTSSSYVPHMENEIVIENEDGNEKGKEPELIVPRESIDEKIEAALDEIYIDQQKMKWSHVDFNFELFSFTEKVRGSPDHYKNHDTGGIRLAFQSQLRNAKKKQPNGKSFNKNDRTEFNQNELAIIAAHANSGGGS